MTNVTRIKNRFGDRLKIMTGVDTVALESLIMGAVGWIAGLVCAFPNETVAIYKLQKNGKHLKNTEKHEMWGVHPGRTGSRIQ